MIVLSPRALAHATRAGRRAYAAHRIPLAVEGILVRESLRVYRDNTRRIAWIIAAEAAGKVAHAEWKARMAAEEAAEEAAYDPESDPMEEGWRRWCAMGNPG